uniref:Uncharacterized protein n=1 Tax=Romanomermis culicivorax TaxID=13658 RepID=A0A915L305_ROMCU
MGSQRLNQMGMKRKALADDKPKPDKYQRRDAKSPDVVGAKEVKTKAKIKAKMEAKPEAKARGDIIEEGLEEAIEFILEKIKTPERDLHDQLDHRPTTCHNMWTV